MVIVTFVSRSSDFVRIEGVTSDEFVDDGFRETGEAPGMQTCTLFRGLNELTGEQMAVPAVATQGERAGMPDFC